MRIQTLDRANPDKTLNIYKLHLLCAMSTTAQCMYEVRESQSTMKLCSLGTARLFEVVFVICMVPMRNNSLYFTICFYRHECCVCHCRYSTSSQHHTMLTFLNFVPTGYE